MPKTFAPGERYKRNYDERDIEQAVEAIKKGLSKKQASKEYGIPRATLQFRLSNKFKKTGHGPTPILTQDEEELLKIDNIKENENEDFMKLYQIWKNFDEGEKQKHKNEDRESISEEILNIEAMELFIDDVHIEYIDECTETNENASLENKSLNLSNICDNIILDQTTKIVDINDQIPSYAGNEKSKQNEVVLPKVVFEEEAMTVNRGLSNFILYPKTPERKGKQNTTERLPFVLTLSGWKQIQRDKEERKIKEEQEKEERKALRINKKQEREELLKTKRIPVIKKKCGNFNSKSIKLKENRQQTKTKEMETETEKEKLTNLVTVPEKSLLYDEERQNSKQFNEKVKILSDIQILPSSRTHIDACKLEECQLKPSSTIPSKHFTELDYKSMIVTRQRLHKEAVLSLNLNNECGKMEVDSGPSYEASTAIMNTTPDSLKDILERQLVARNTKFTPELQDTLQAWYMVIDGPPGFSKESFNALQLQLQEDKNVIINPVMEEMSIRELIEILMDGDRKVLYDPNDNPIEWK
ncbi:hypothetical protein ILUMI_08165 [Ignelater luminosus]|uniref:HTH psq-type domain-containing protein n=1 Tax=Ignelater luminosus TaxID=2038154 RepID=A0A8K0D6T6_IGNLU|nr:hypothetical protein ILUMI_08165 [Ignelater luminosus]